MIPPTFDTPADLEQQLSEILVRGPLYREFVYYGRDCHRSERDRFGKHLRSGNLPKNLKMFCGNRKCNQEQLWETDRYGFYFAVELINEVVYVCRNCGEEKAYFYFIWHELEKESVFLKVGQFPALSIEPSPELSKALGKENSQLYKKGLINANFNHGLGAIAYFRRVLENKINALLDLIAEAAANEKVQNEDLKKIEQVKKSHRVEDKITLASKILPAHLKPGGHNPIDKLYDSYSTGLHGESDDECLRKADEGRFIFEYLFKNLTAENEQAREYAKRLSRPKQPA